MSTESSPVAPEHGDATVASWDENSGSVTVGKRAPNVLGNARPAGVAHDGAPSNMDRRQSAAALESSRGGGGKSSGRGVVLTEERLAAVRCYFRDDDPIFIRTNLKRLLEGTLICLEKGDTVTVARR